MPEITVGTFLQEKSEDLKLELITGVEGLPRLIKVSEINRPGLAFTGYMEHFPAERIQIIGLSEYSYLSSLAPEILTETLERILSYPSLPCVILAREFDPLPEMLRRGYDKVMITGVIQAGSSLGILIPPSNMMIVYGIITQQSIGKLFIAGFLPGLSGTSFLLSTSTSMRKEF